MKNEIGIILGINVVCYCLIIIWLIFDILEKKNESIDIIDIWVFWWENMFFWNDSKNKYMCIFY